MYLAKFQPQIKALIAKLQHSSERVWFFPLLAVLAFIDNFILVIPVDSILISSSMLNPKKWLKLSLVIGIGSTLGALLLYQIIYIHGVNFIGNHFLELTLTSAWKITEKFYHQYGIYVVFLVSISPFTQQPAIILAGLGKVHFSQFLLAVSIGRIAKYIVLSYIGSHAPHLLKKYKIFDSELDETNHPT